MMRIDTTFRPVVPMKYFSAKNKEALKEALDSDEYVLQKKIDGASYTFAKDADGVPHIWGDKISKKTGEIIEKTDNCPHIKAFIEKEFPPCSMIVGELYTHYDYTTNNYRKREESKFVNSIMLALPEKAAARQYSTQLLSLYVFDILWWNNVSFFDKMFVDRDDKLESLFEEHNWSGRYQWLEKAETFADNKSAKIGEWLADGYEGGVLKKLNGIHPISEIGESSKRPAHLTYKIKTVDTCDVVIMDIEHPDKEYKGKNAETYEYRDDEGNPVNRLWYFGMINAFSIGAYNDNGELIKIGTIASGLDDSIRLDAAKNPDNYIGSVIECECMSLDKENHTIRHPRFIRIRSDKNSLDCTISHIFG